MSYFLRSSAFKGIYFAQTKQNIKNSKKNTFSGKFPISTLNTIKILFFFFDDNLLKKITSNHMIDSLTFIFNFQDQFQVF